MTISTHEDLLAEIERLSPHTAGILRDVGENISGISPATPPAQWRNEMHDPTNPFAPRLRDAMHEADCPMQSPHPTACCNCGNPKAIKWDEASGKFVDPYHRKGAS